MAYQTITVEEKPKGILRIGLNRPDVRNAFNDEVIDDLSEAFANEASDPRIKAVVLFGHGKVFCAGGDMNWLKKAVDYSYEENIKDTMTLAKMFAQLNEFPKPVIGGVHGAAIGGGVGLVSICDVVVVEEETVFSLSEVRLGVVPACIGPFVIAKIGASNARRLFISGERFGPELSQNIGLTHMVAKGESGMIETLDGVVASLLKCGPSAMGVAKKLVHDLSWPEARANVGDPLSYVSKCLSDLRVTEEAQEGLRSFLEKRKPNWLEAGE